MTKEKTTDEEKLLHYLILGGGPEIHTPSGYDSLGYILKQAGYFYNVDLRETEETNLLYTQLLQIAGAIKIKGLEASLKEQRAILDRIIPVIRDIHRLDWVREDMYEKLLEATKEVKHHLKPERNIFSRIFDRDMDVIKDLKEKEREEAKRFEEFINEHKRKIYFVNRVVGLWDKGNLNQLENDLKNVKESNEKLAGMLERIFVGEKQGKLSLGLVYMTFEDRINNASSIKDIIRNFEDLEKKMDDLKKILLEQEGYLVKIDLSVFVKEFIEHEKFRQSLEKETKLSSEIYFLLGFINNTLFTDVLPANVQILILTKQEMFRSSVETHEMIDKLWGVIRKKEKEVESKAGKQHEKDYFELIKRFGTFVLLTKYQRILNNKLVDLIEDYKKNQTEENLLRLIIRGIPILERLIKINELKISNSKSIETVIIRLLKDIEKKFGEKKDAVSDKIPAEPVIFKVSSKRYATVKAVEVRGELIHENPDLVSAIDPKKFFLFLTGVEWPERRMVKVRVYADHGRTFEINDVYQEDKYGNIYSLVQIKGGGHILGNEGSLSQSPIAKVWRQSSNYYISGYMMMGLLDENIAYQVFVKARYLLEKGLRVEMPVYVIELNEIVYGSEILTLNECRKRKIIPEDFIPVLLVRALGVNERIRDFLYSSSWTKRIGMLEKTFRFLNYEQKIMAKRGKIKKPIFFDKNHIFTYLKWHAETLMQNVAKLHALGRIHDYLTDHNIGFDARLLDIDSVKESSDIEKYGGDLKKITKTLHEFISHFRLSPSLLKEYHDGLIKAYKEFSKNEDLNNYLVDLLK